MSAADICTPDLSDDHSAARALALPWRSYGNYSSFCGQVVTVKCFEDNSMVKQLVAEPGRGRVIVVDGGGSLRRALLGDMLAEQAAQNGWSGLVINGAVRDVEVLARTALGIFALGSVPVKTDKRGQGLVDCSLEIAGTAVQPGDSLYADANGVLISESPLLD